MEGWVRVGVGVEESLDPRCLGEEVMRVLNPPPPPPLTPPLPDILMILLLSVFLSTPILVLLLTRS